MAKSRTKRADDKLRSDSSQSCPQFTPEIEPWIQNYGSSELIAANNFCGSKGFGKNDAFNCAAFFIRSVCSPPEMNKIGIDAWPLLRHSFAISNPLPSGRSTSKITTVGVSFSNALFASAHDAASFTVNPATRKICATRGRSWMSSSTHKTVRFLADSDSLMVSFHQVCPSDCTSESQCPQTMQGKVVRNTQQYLLHFS